MNTNRLRTSPEAQRKDPGAMGVGLPACGLRAGGDTHRRLLLVHTHQAGFKAVRNPAYDVGFLLSRAYLDRHPHLVWSRLVSLGGTSSGASLEVARRDAATDCCRALSAGEGHSTARYGCEWLPCWQSPRRLSWCLHRRSTSCSCREAATPGVSGSSSFLFSRSTWDLIHTWVERDLHHRGHRALYDALEVAGSRHSCRAADAGRGRSLTRPPAEEPEP